MRYILFLPFLLLPYLGKSQCPIPPQNPDFEGHMSQAQLEGYLSRSVCMARLALPKTVEDSVFEHYLEVLRDHPPRYIGRVSLFWSDWHYHRLFEQTRERVCRIHQSVDDRIICAAGLMENINRQPFELPWRRGVGAKADDPVSGEMKGQIPIRVLEAFPYYEGPPFWGYAQMPVPGSVTMDSSLYDPGLMMGETNGYNIIPDITKVQTKMWYYWQAINYIDCGIEAFHFGQTGVICRNDTPDYQHLREVVEKIRVYGRQHARRKLVLINGGRLGEGEELVFDFTKVSSRTKEAPPLRPESGGGNAVLGDFQQCGAIQYYCKCQHGAACSNPGSCYDAIYGAPVSGRHPLGWDCAPCPYLAEIDHGIAPASQAYNRVVTENAGDAYKTFGVDEITWFAEQTPDYQQDWSRYAYHKVRCMDEHGYLELPGIRGILDESSPAHPQFYASPELMGVYTQIWEGESRPLTVASTKLPASSGLFALQADEEGNIYSISSDLKLTRLYRTGTGLWQREDLHEKLAAAGISEEEQALPYEQLKLSPSGDWLFYNGSNGHIYATSTGEEPAFVPLLAGGRFAGHLHVPNDSLLFYVSEDRHIWQHQLTEQGWTARDLHNTADAPLAARDQGQGEGGLAYHDSQLYYIDALGRIGQLRLEGTSVTHRFITQEEDALGGLLHAAPTAAELYYIGRDRLLHGYRLEGNQWVAHSPASSAAALGQAAAVQARACPPYHLLQLENGILLFPARSGIGGYSQSAHGYFHAFSLPVPAGTQAIVELTPASSGQWYISSFPELAITQYEMQAAPCGPIFPHRPIELCEPEATLPQVLSDENYRAARWAMKHYRRTALAASVQLNLYPNPARHELNVALEGWKGGLLRVELFNAHGQMVNTKTVESAVRAAPATELIRFDLQRLPAGLYVVRITHQGQTAASQRLIVY